MTDEHRDAIESAIDAVDQRIAKSIPAPSEAVFLSAASEGRDTEPGGGGVPGPTRPTDRDRHELLEENAAAFARVFASKRLLTEACDEIRDVLRNYLLPNDTRKKIVVGDVEIRRYERVELRCDCCMAPLEVCATAIAGQKVKILRVTMPPSFDVRRIEKS